MRLPLSIVIVFATSIPSAQAGTRYVNRALTTGANDGSSWADAYRDADAVAIALLAAAPGDEVWVAAGTYVPTTSTDRTRSHVLKTAVAIYGGFAGTESSVSERDWTSNITVLSGDIGFQGPVADNSFNVVYAASVGATAVLDGFTVTAGNASAGGGGGLHCTPGGNATIRNCRFLANRAGHAGGAYVTNAAPSFEDCTFEANQATSGASIGGGIWVTGSATTEWVRLDRCIFVANRASQGSALAGNAILTNSLVYDNVATGSGGGAIVTNGRVVNCTIARNLSMVDPTAGVAVPPGVAIMLSCIVWENTGPGGSQGYSSQIDGALTAFRTIVQNAPPQTSLLSVDPGFVDPGNGDFRLSVGSPAIDAGQQDNMPLPPLDLSRRARYVDDPSVPDTGIGTTPIVDIGAYEHQVPIVRALCFGDGSGTPCPCGNEAPPASGQGCLNSTGVGAVLGFTGSARILSDSFVLLGSNMPGTASALYFQGTTSLNAENGVAFGDGLRCAGGTLIRLGTKTNAGGASQYPAASDPSVSVRGAIGAPGSERTYQCWYRNAATFCQTESFNLTNAVSVTWEL